MTTPLERIFMDLLDVTRPVRNLFRLRFSQNTLLRRAVAGNAAIERLLNPNTTNLVKPDAALEERQIKNCRVVENRYRLLEHLPKDAVCCEVGIANGDFSEQILAKTAPRKLHLVEFSERFVRGAEQRFADPIEKGSVAIHHGDSARELAKFPDAYFDWMYIDANHTYEFVQRELEISRLKLKPGGVIILNDYICYDHVYRTEYGVVEAVNQFCVRYDYELIYFAFHPLMYCDVAIRKIPNP